ncbi:MAG: DivIVA domain-containing protein [Oscillospiraceae bacterium]|nr:DivIVA domain-containing protein [Oscillospiraceae bacterium]
MKRSKVLTKKKFEKSAMFGYKVEDVDNFVAQITDENQRLCEENEVLEQKLSVLAHKIEEYRNDEDNLRAILLKAKELADDIVKQARDQAASIVAAAKKNADDISASINAQTAKKRGELARMQRETADFQAKIVATYESQLRNLARISDNEIQTSEVQANVETIANEVKRQMVKPAEDASVTRQFGSFDRIKRCSIDVETNKNGDLISKCGVLQFGSNHPEANENSKKTRLNKAYHVVD